MSKNGPTSADDAQSSEEFVQLIEFQLNKICQCKTFNLLSEEVLRELITRHGLKPNNNLNIRDYEFFLRACCNERVTEGIIRCLLEYFPDAGSFTSTDGKTPLHLICNNTNVTRSMVELLIDAAPNSVRIVTQLGWMPLHCLCLNRKLDDETSMEILKLLIQKCPQAVRHADYDTGFLPVHRACGSRAPDFCRVLIEAYPGSGRITASNGMLPIHIACTSNTVATVEYLYKLYPEVIHHKTANGVYPIHFAMKVKLQTIGGRISLLHFACRQQYTHPNIEAALEMIKVIYDAHPEAIEDSRIVSTFQYFHQQVQTFLNTQLAYSRQARDHRLMMTPDVNGQLPLHTALQSNVRLGSIKLLVKGNPSAIRTFDRSGLIPLHVACRHHDSTVVQYLVGLDTTTLDAMDREGNTALHCACLGAEFDTIALLLDKYDAVSVSKRNAQKKLPIDILWDSNAVVNRESVEYTESVFRLLKAYPETVMNIE
ncbi:ankyrin repeat domain-containing protein [Skeletonema marinoi]|uniref:Ankyrin repeat domain-containing protein n=2 Tax=Skeletonema marinoi TaxID=267567 RepID=A0AAD8XUV9_9STRA|nr:ankyrin repeat domain-containing protein [Skeletonema marinoi]